MGVNEVFPSLFLLFSLLILSSSVTANANNNKPVKSETASASHKKNVLKENNCLVDQSSSGTEDCGLFTQGTCEASNCCWHPSLVEGEPWCYKPSGAPVTSYTLASIDTTQTGFEGVLTLTNPATSIYGDDITTLKLEVLMESNDYVRVKITDSTKSRWEVPQSIVSRPSVTQKATNLGYEFTYTESPFTFEVTRTSDGASIFKSSEQLIFKDQFIQLSTSISTDANTYGLGESTRLEHALQPGSTYTLWAADIAAASFYSNLYGSFPLYLQMVNGMAHGALLMNSNGMDAIISGANDVITFKVLGGIIDLYVFSGPTPASVVSQYTGVVGRPMMMPYWSLGFHNCKYGYTSLAQIEEVVAGYESAGIPLDTQWSDIDYMEAYRDFTTDPVNFPIKDMATFVDGLHEKGMSFVVIIDPGIMVYDEYAAYNDGVAGDLYVKDITGGYYLGQVWPGPTTFPDFTHPKSQDYWTQQLLAFNSQVDVDGYWIDMNEVSNFCNVDGAGQYCENSAPEGCPAPGASQTECCLVCNTVDSSNTQDFPPYNIGNKYGHLSTKTMAMSAQHYNNVSVYDMHNLYGITEQIATNAALTEIRGKRPFLLTRSSFIGSGKVTAKWTGDNAATWDDLKSSIVSIMDFSIFGVPMVGADICGFIDDTTEELCARWIEVGAFYAFSRDHNTLGAAPQELYLWPSVTEAAQKALAMRYRMLPFMYTLLYNAHTDGATFATPLFFNFPSDENTVGIDEQFMVGESVLISPAVSEGQTSVNAYFPKQLWYNFADFSLDIDASEGGKTVEIPTSLTDVNVHVKGGSILPLQESAMTTTQGRTTPFTLLAALCPEGHAEGNLFWDDGEQINLDHYISASYVSDVVGSEGSFYVSSMDKSDYESENIVGTVTVLGKDLKVPTSVSLNGKPVPSGQILFDATKGSLSFTNIDINIGTTFKLIWS